MPTIQGVGPDDRSIPLKCDSQGHLIVVFNGSESIAVTELKASRPWALWASVALHCLELGAIGYFIGQLLG